MISALNWLNAASGLVVNVREYHSTASAATQRTWCPAVASATGAKITMGLAGGSTDTTGLLSLLNDSSNSPTRWFTTIEGGNEPNNTGSGLAPRCPPSRRSGTRRIQSPA